MLTGWRLILAIVVVVALSVTGTTALLRAIAPTAAATSTAALRSQQVTVALPAPLQHAAHTIEVGGRRVALQTNGATSTATVQTTRGAAGIGVVRDAKGAAIATAPVWNEPGVTSGAPRVTCDSTAFDRFLLSPALGVDRPIEVDLLWSVSSHAPVLTSLDRFGARLCAVQAERGAAASSTDAGVLHAERVYIKALFSRLGAARQAVEQRAAALGPEGPSIALASFVTRTEEGACDDAGSLAPESSGNSALVLCEAKGEVVGTNSSGSWQLVYPRHHASALSPVMAVPPEAIEIPTIEELLTDLAKDTLQDVAVEICKGWHLSNDCGDYGDRLQKALHVVEPATGSGIAAKGYVSIGFGSPAGYPDETGLTSGDIDLIRTRALAMTLITQGMLPLVWLVLDMKPEAEGAGSIKREVLTDAIKAVIDSTLSVPYQRPSSLDQWTADLVHVVKELLDDNDLFVVVIHALAPELIDELLPELAIKLVKELTGYAIPGVGELQAILKAQDAVVASLNILIGMNMLADAGTKFSTMTVWRDPDDPDVPVVGCDTREIDDTDSQFSTIAPTRSKFTLPFTPVSRSSASVMQAKWGPGSVEPVFTLAPAGASCTNLTGSGPSSTAQIIDADGITRLSAEYNYEDGTPYGCTYLAEQAKASAAEGLPCTPWTGATLLSQSYDSGNVHVVVVEDQAKKVGRYWKAGASTGDAKKVVRLVVIYPWNGGRQNSAGSIDCPLEPGDENFCADGLSLFLQQDVSMFQADAERWHDAQGPSASLDVNEVTDSIHTALVAAIAAK